MLALPRDARERESDPHGVAREKVVVFGSSQVAHKAEFYDEVVNEFLRLLLGESTRLQISFDIYIHKLGYSAN